MRAGGRGGGECQGECGGEWVGCTRKASEAQTSVTDSCHSKAFKARDDGGVVALEVPGYQVLHTCVHTCVHTTATPWHPAWPLACLPQTAHLRQHGC
eukprot:129589-Chlamydomonas_euryale.AAC.2